MYEAKNTQRALVRIGYDGRVYKTFRGPLARERFLNEAKILKHLEQMQCVFVPQLFEANENELRIVTSHCGARVDQLSPARIAEIFADLEKYGVRHDDPYLRNITYRASDGRFCVIDFEFATLLSEEPTLASNSPHFKGTLLPMVRWSAMTHRGRFRANNEDRFLAILLENKGVRYLGKSGDASLEAADCIFAVSDGMGGEQSGEFASKIAVEKITQQLPREYQLTAERFASHSRQILFSLFESIHNEMTRLGAADEQCTNMGATLSLGWFRRERFYFAHVGDSRIYHLPASGGMIQLTEDHSHVGWLRRNGKLNERQARSHPRRNVLAQALGAGYRYLDPQIGSIECEVGDRIVMVTDGVTDGLWDHAIQDLIREPQGQFANLHPPSVWCSKRSRNQAATMQPL